MPKNEQFTWESKNLLDDISYQESDAISFKKLLNGAKKDEEQKLEIAPGTILRGRIVEISKDYIVVDVGLKSEGLVPFFFLN